MLLWSTNMILGIRKARFAIGIDRLTWLYVMWRVVSRKARQLTLGPSFSCHGAFASSARVCLTRTRLLQGCFAPSPSRERLVMHGPEPSRWVPIFCSTMLIKCVLEKGGPMKSRPVEAARSQIRLVRWGEDGGRCYNKHARPNPSSGGSCCLLYAMEGQGMSKYHDSTFAGAVLSTAVCGAQHCAAKGGGRRRNLPVSVLGRPRCCRSFAARVALRKREEGTKSARTGRVVSSLFPRTVLWLSGESACSPDRTHLGCIKQTGLFDWRQQSISSSSSSSLSSEQQPPILLQRGSTTVRVHNVRCTVRSSRSSNLTLPVPSASEAQVAGPGHGVAREDRQTTTTTTTTTWAAPCY